MTLAAAPTASRPDAARIRRWSGYMPHAEWIVPLAVGVLAAVLRLVWLDHPHALVFDETYYVKDARSLALLGYEGTWPSGYNPTFITGDASGLSPQGSYVVHPPLGKWVIALGMMLFGADNGWGWRFGTAVCGILAVLVLYGIARTLTGSAIWAGVAGGLFAIDGLGIVLSRVGLLDIVLTLFLLLGSWCVLLDRRRTVRLIARGTPPWGPVLWRRPWILAAGLMLGAATAVKWSGVYALAGFGIYLVVTDLLARRRAGMERWALGAILRQGPVSFLLLVPPALLAYVLSWTGWLVTSGGFDRDADANPLIALWKYHLSAYSFHVGLTSPHSYASPAWQWLLMPRPTSMYWRNDDGTAQAITSLDNPLIWYLGVICAFVLLYRFVLTSDHRYAFVLTGLAVSYLPWLAFPERTIFQFYTVVIVPFLILALTLVLQLLTAPDAAALERDPGPARAPARRSAYVHPPAAPEGDAALGPARSAAVAPSAAPDPPAVLDPPGRSGSEDPAHLEPEEPRETARFRDDELELLREGEYAPPIRWFRMLRSRRILVAGILIAIVVVSAFFYPIWTAMPVPYVFWLMHMWIPGWV